MEKIFRSSNSRMFVALNGFWHRPRNVSTPIYTVAGQFDRFAGPCGAWLFPLQARGTYRQRESEKNLVQSLLDSETIKQVHVMSTTLSIQNFIDQESLTNPRRQTSIAAHRNAGERSSSSAGVSRPVSSRHWEFFARQVSSTLES